MKTTRIAMSRKTRSLAHFQVHLEFGILLRHGINSFTNRWHTAQKSEDSFAAILIYRTGLL